MAGYTKLFSSILHSTIWREPNHVRIVWITLLAMAGKTGVVDASIPGLADAARVPLADCEEALRRLQEPDPYSRSGDQDGRRIEPVDGGWRLVNHAKYREKMNLDERRAYLAAKQREGRRKHKSQQMSTNVAMRAEPSTLSTHASSSSSSSSSPSSSPKKNIQKTVRPATEPPDPNVAVFLKWFPKEYQRLRAGADYLVRHGRDGPLVKAMLHATALDKLQKYAQMMLSHECDDLFIQKSDRGIGVLSTKFNWLADKYAARVARHQGIAVGMCEPKPIEREESPEPEPWICRHPEPRCAHRVMCGIRSGIEARKARAQ